MPRNAIRSVIGLAMRIFGGCSSSRGALCEGAGASAAAAAPQMTAARTRTVRPVPVFMSVMIGHGPHCGQRRRAATVTKCSPRPSMAAIGDTGPLPLGRCPARGRGLALHRLEELGVGLRVLHLVEQELDGRELIHRMQ